MDHSFEEIRGAAIDVLAGRETSSYPLNQYGNILTGVAEVLARREGIQAQTGFGFQLSSNDSELFLEVFWSLFREGIITLGLNDANRNFPHCRVSEYGRRTIANQDTYFYHDVTSYEQLLQREIQDIDDITLVYLKEAMRAFRTGCLLASSVMLGVATEHTFLQLSEKTAKSAALFAAVSKERGILRKVNLFWKTLEDHAKALPPEIKEDLDTHFVGILSIIRGFRNESGHPSGKFISREQTYVLLNLFIPYCKKMYQLMRYFEQ